MKTPSLMALSIAGILSATPVLCAQPVENTPAKPIRTLLLTGHNNHNWQFTSRIHAETLEATGLFSVTITDDPASSLSDPASLKGYQLFVLDYNDSHAPKRWGEPAETNFSNAVRSGAGVVAIHAANNAFKGWVDYETMLGLMWREGTGHGKFHSFDLEYVDATHPVLAGLPVMTAHPDELYHRLVNEHRSPTRLLARAFDSPDIGGTGEREPMVFTLEFGTGRIFATPLGHVWVNSDESKASILDPQFRSLLARGSEWAATGSVTLPAAWSDIRPHNVLTSAEAAEGWTLLFDGQTTNNFRGFKSNAFPAKGWVVKDGVLWRLPGESGGDIVTEESYSDFELCIDWNVAKGGNSGIIFRSTEDHSYCWETGPEIQILDNVAHPDNSNGKNRAGALYDILPCSADVCRPAGEWNSSLIRVKGSKIEHFLNGILVIQTDTQSEAYKKALSESKWTQYPDFGTRPSGVIALQDHGDEVRFRDVKVRRLTN